MTKISRGLANRGMTVKALAAHPHPGSVANHWILNGCDIGLSSLVASGKGISVPSRSCNILCAGKSILAVGKLQGERNVGWVVAPGDCGKIVLMVKEYLVR